MSSTAKPVTATASIGPSGRTLTVQTWDANGAHTNLTALVGAPTLSINGGAPITPTGAQWGITSHYTPYVIYPIENITTTIQAGDTATLTIPAGTFTTVAGAVPAGTITVANGTGGSDLPTFDPTAARTLRVGSNLSTVTDFMVLNFYTNLMTQGTGMNGPDANGYPTGPFPTSSALLADGPADVTDPLNYPNAPAGTYTVKWDGLYTANLVLEAGTGTTVTLLSDVQGVNGIDNVRLYNVAVNSSRHSPRINLIEKAAGATNIRVYQPGEPTDGSQLFGTNALRLATGYAALRFMNTTWTDRSCVVDFDDFPPTNQLSFHNGVGYFVGGNVVSISPYTDPDNTFLFNPEWCSYTITFDAPHNAKTGQVLVFNNGQILTDAGAGVFNTTGGGKSQPLWNSASVVRVLDATRVAAHHFATGGGGTITGTYPQTGLTFKGTTRQGMPPAHCSLFSSAAGADCWYSAPHASTDACISDQAWAILSNLAPGLKCYLEYTNEHWNTGPTFEQNDYFRSIGLSMPGTGATATATVTSGKVTTLTVTNAGAGYLMAPALTIAPPASGTTATGHATLLNGTLALVIDNQGSGYDPANPPAVTLNAAISLTSAYVWKAANVHRIFAAAFAAAGRPNDLVRVMGSQYHGPGATTAPLVAAASHNGITFDALAVAPYYDNKLGLVAEPSLAASSDRFDVEMLHDLSQIAMQFGPYFSLFASHRALLDANGYAAVPFVCYEGGPQTGTPAGSTVDTIPRSLSWGRDPRMRELMLYWLTQLQAHGVVLYMDFLLFSTSFGTANWAKYRGYAQRAGMGDGSDGLHDNRTDYFDLSKFVSVMGGAINTWNEAVAPPVPAPVATRPARRRPGLLATMRADRGGQLANHGRHV